jgi:3-methyladenine DNA glycosylase/8-oxoguanine DNA glycosylase
MPATTAQARQAMNADAHGCWHWPERFDFFETTRLLRTGRNDPTVRRMADGLWRSVRTTQGAASVRLVVIPGHSVSAAAWGPGAGAAIAAVPSWLGLNRPPPDLPAHPVTDRLLRDHGGVRLADTGDVFEALVNIVLQQKVTWNEAACNWRRLVEALGETAPGPAGLLLVPSADRLRRTGVDQLVRLGVNRPQAMTLREIAFSADRLQRAAQLPTMEAARWLEHVRGVGPWTSAMTLGLRLGRPEPLVRGDYKLPHAVAWAFAGKARGDDGLMAGLLAPFAGQAFYVVRLLYAARVEAPRRGPKRQIRFGRY